MKVFKLVAWLFLIVGISAASFESLMQYPSFTQVYPAILQLFLLGMSAFFVFKRVAFYRMHGKVDTIKLSKKSDYQLNLVLYGILLTICCLIVVKYAGQLKSFHTITIGTIFLYYLSQIYINSQPAIYISDDGVAYDDYFVNDFSWKKLERIELEDEKIRLITPEKDFELDFDVVDQIDYRNLKAEIEMNILDGSFTKGNSSTDLIDIIRGHANRHKLQLIKRSA